MQGNSEHSIGLNVSKNNHVIAVAGGGRGVYGCIWPRLIATVWLALVQNSPLRTYIRLL